jgi:hypothetical protein
MAQVMKVSLYNEYISCCGRQGVSIILNGNLHSSSTLFAAKYIEIAKDIVCDDLRSLVTDVVPELQRVDASMLAEDAPWGDDTESYLFWKRTSPSGFMEKNFLLEVMLQRHNADFFLLTPQNLKITNEVTLSSLMYRIGQANGFTYIGILPRQIFTPPIFYPANSKFAKPTNRYADGCYRHDVQAPGQDQLQWAGAGRDEEASECGVGHVSGGW